MGAWGVGMRANDTALDAIGDENRIKRIIRDKDKKALKKLLEKFSAQGILGVVDFMLDEGVPHTFFDTCRPIIDKAIDDEKSELDAWQDPEARRRALNLLKKRLQGKKVSPEELAKGNEGLITKVMQAINATQQDG